MGPDITADVNHCRIRPPGAAQGDIVQGSITGEHTIIEYIAHFFFRRCGGSGNMRILFAVYMALLEPYGGRTKNKIRGTLYVTMLVILPAC